MRKAWGIVLVIVFIVILLGVTAIGVGYFTGADIELVYGTLEQSPAALFINTLITYWNAVWAWAQPYWLQLTALFGF